MKKLNKLFAILFAVLGVQTLSAQEWTDKTSLLANPSFENETTATNLGSGKNGWGGPTGWILSPSTAPSNSQSGAIASSCNIQGIATTFPTADGGNYFYVRTNWNNNVTFSLSQEVSGELPAGLYRLTCKAASNSGNWSTSKFSLTLKEGDGNVSTNSSLNKCSAWSEWTIDLYKNDPSTSLTIEATMYPGSSGSGQHYQMLLDDFKLEYMSFDDIEAAGWPKPQVPGSNLKSFVGTSVVAALYNVGSDAFVTRGMTWATQAIATKLHNSDSQTQATSDRHHVKVSAGDGDLVRFAVNGKNYLGDGGQGTTTTVYTDNGNTNTNQFIYSQLNEGTYKLKVKNATSDVDAFLDVSQPYGGQLTYAKGQGFTEWAIIKFSDIENGKYASYKAKRAMYEVYKAVVDAGHSATYSDALSTALETYIKPNATASDVTTATNVLINAVSPALTAGYVNAGALFTNPDMRGAGTKADWTSGYTNLSWGVFENYHTNHGDRKLTQTKTVPNGFYKVVFHGIWRQDGGDAAPTLTLTSGSNSISANVPCMTDIAFGVGNAFTEGNNVNNWKDVNGKIIPNGMQSAGEGLSHRDAQVTISDFVVSDGQLTIEMNSSSTSQWILAQGFDIYFKAESLDEYANLFKEAKAAADAIDASTLNTYAKNTLTTALNNAATEQIDKEWYQARTAELNNAVAIAKDVAAPYAKVSELLATCENILNNSLEFVEDATATFTSAVNDAKKVEDATTADAINSIYNTLEAARQTYVQQADPTNDICFDYTFLIKNPSFETGNTDGWTTSSGGDTGAKLNSNGTYTINGADGEFVFNTWGADNMRVEQTLKGIPTGIYTLKAIVASDANSVIELTAGNETKEITITTNKSTATEGVVETSYSSGDFLIKAASATWFKADHFRLYYYGFDVPTAQNGVTTLKAEAEALVGKAMNADVATALTAAINGADASKTTRNELNPMISVLDAAVGEAEASIAEYELIRKYIDKAKVFDEDDTDLATLETQYTNGVLTMAEPVRQALNVWTYNYVATNFKNEIAVTEWTGTMGTLSGQHWDGTEATSYYDGASWQAGSHTLSASVSLTAGDYVFRAAGRSSAVSVLTLTVQGQTITFNAKGDKGYGIDTNGNANFSNEGTYANNNAGRGWEWEFVKFSLSETTTVVLEASSTYNGGWASFANIGLWMDDATYVQANVGALAESLEVAKVLVDTKPMGAAENEALKEAVVQGEAEITTPAQLDAAIAALNTSVENANKWVAAYNEAKAPLVAALERFEADYNGVKMSKSDWENVLNKVKAAAVAKDVTDSYEGFAVAAEELNAALDAAQASINAYAALNEAIVQAETLASANVGDQPFQRPVSAQTTLNAAIATAQAAYDAAEADATEVKSTLDTAVGAFNNAELNKPAEGDVFKVAIRPDQSWQLTDKPLTFADNGTGGISIFKNRDANYYAQTMMLKQVEGNKYTMSTIAANGTELYVSTGKTSGHGSSNVQIRLTDDVNKALHIEIIPTATEGLYNLKNTEADALLGCQDDKEQGGLYTCNVRNNFTITKVDMPSVTIKTPSYWATMILPFAAEIPEGLTVYSCKEAVGKVLTLDKVEKIEANTPYLICGETIDFEHTFIGFGAATATSYTVGLFTGTYVDYETKANNNEYVLQKNNGVLGFYLVGESAKPTVKAYRCYMTYDNAAGAPMFRIGEDETTSIHNSEFSTQDSAVVYDLMGRKVNTLEKGGMYIVNGKKVVIK